jgi:hypothetical protein
MGSNIKGKYLYRFPKVGMPRFEEYGEGRISKKEWDMHRYLKGFNDFFENLFELNNFSYFDELQETLETGRISFKKLFIKDIFAYELLRIYLGFKNYSGIEKMGKFTGRSLLFSVTHDPNFFPTASDLSFVLHKIPAKALFSFFHQLVQECIETRITVPRILIWDRQFIRTNCNNKKTIVSLLIMILTQDTTAIMV